jgi:hypothetical protein
MNQIISAYGKGIDAVVNKKRYNGIMVVSPGYPLFESRNLEEYCEEYLKNKGIDQFSRFGLEYFKDFSLFICDKLLHYNLMAFCEMAEEEALKKAEFVGKYSREICSEIAGYISKEIKVYAWNDFNFEKELSACRYLANQNSIFKQQCLDLTRAGTRNRLDYIKKEFGKRKYQEVIATAGNYAVDDIASMLYFYEQGYITLCKYELFPVIKDIHIGNYPELNGLCLEDKIGHIQIALKYQKIYRGLYDDEFEKTAKA